MRACQQLPDRAACLAPQLASSSLFTAITGTTTFAAAASAGLGADKAKAAFLRGFRELLGAALRTGPWPSIVLLRVTMFSFKLPLCCQASPPASGLTSYA